MNKKIKIEIALTTILVIALIIGFLFWIDENKKSSEIIPNEIITPAQKSPTNTSLEDSTFNDIGNGWKKYNKIGYFSIEYPSDYTFDGPHPSGLSITKSISEKKCLEEVKWQWCGVTLSIQWGLYEKGIDQYLAKQENKEEYKKISLIENSDAAMQRIGQPLERGERDPMGNPWQIRKVYENKKTHLIYIIDLSWPKVLESDQETKNAIEILTKSFESFVIAP